RGELPGIDPLAASSRPLFTGSTLRMDHPYTGGDQRGVSNDPRGKEGDVRQLRSDGSGPLSREARPEASRFSQEDFSISRDDSRRYWICPIQSRGDGSALLALGRAL